MAEAGKSKETPSGDRGDSEGSAGNSPKKKGHPAFPSVDPPTNNSVNRFAYENVNISKNYHLVMTKFDASDILLEPKPVKVLDESDEE